MGKKLSDIFQKVRKKMDNKTTRILIETMIKKSIHDMDDSPKRSVRNLVDMALQFSKGRFQKYFFKIAQTMLTKQDSSYYPLIQDVVSHVDFKHLITLGMNIGYNSCTVGAGKIREIEAKCGYNIPWSVILEINAEINEDMKTLYHKRIQEGESMGIHTWLIFCDCVPSILNTLCKSFPDSAFLIFCPPKVLSEDFIEEMSSNKNMMFVLQYSEQIEFCCQRLRAYHLPYSFYYVYHEKDFPFIESGELFNDAEQHHPIFTVLLGDSTLSLTQKKHVYYQIKDFRDSQNYQTIPWELTFDHCHIDSIISDDPCTVVFDKYGNLHTLKKQYHEKKTNLFHQTLETIFSAVLLK